MIRMSMIAAAVVCAATLAGCSGGAETDASTPTPSVAAGSPTEAESPSVAPSAAPTYWDGDRTAEAAPAVSSAPATAGVDDSSPQGVAVTFMRLYARPSVDAATWWRDLSDYFTPQASIDYQTVDPANIPAKKVTGQAKLLPSSSPNLARAHVMTDYGTYLVVMSRGAEDPTWKVARVVPPEEGVGD